MAFLDRFRRKQEVKVVKRNYAGVNTGRLFADFVRQKDQQIVSLDQL